jgi:hypothetical protein
MSRGTDMRGYSGSETPGLQVGVAHLAAAKVPGRWFRNSVERSAVGAAGYQDD